MRACERAKSACVCVHESEFCLSWYMEKSMSLHSVCPIYLPIRAFSAYASPPFYKCTKDQLSKLVLNSDSNPPHPKCFIPYAAIPHKIPPRAHSHAHAHTNTNFPGEMPPPASATSSFTATNPKTLGSSTTRRPYATPAAATTSSTAATAAGPASTGQAVMAQDVRGGVAGQGAAGSMSERGAAQHSTQHSQRVLTQQQQQQQVRYLTYSS
jgi:hypothetical protein